MGWGTLNLITTIGSFVFAVGVLLFFVNVLKSLRRGRPGRRQSLGRPTLEWSVPSPPPPYNFAVIPTVASRHPLVGRPPAGRDDARPRSIAACCSMPARRPSAPSALDAEPDMILEMPEDSLAPVGAGGRA